MVEVMVVNKIIGFNIGIVILVNFVNVEAPSISAASYIEGSIFCIPDK